MLRLLIMSYKEEEHIRIDKIIVKDVYLDGKKCKEVN